MLAFKRQMQNMLNSNKTVETLYSKIDMLSKRDHIAKYVHNHVVHMMLKRYMT